jgi:hypothetical protein
MKKPRRGGLRRWCTRKRRAKRGSEARLRQRLETAEARGRDEGSGGRRRIISERRSSSSSGAAGGEQGWRRRLAVNSRLMLDVVDLDWNSSRDVE